MEAYGDVISSPLMVVPLSTTGGGGADHSAVFNINNQKFSFINSDVFLTSGGELDDDYDTSIIKAKIMSHPQYPRLLSAYLNCYKVGAPPEVAARLDEASASSLMLSCRPENFPPSSSVGESDVDPSLDQFMEAYCEMLTKYEQEISKPFKEAMFFLSRVDSHFKSLSLSPPSSSQDLINEDCNKGFSEQSDDDIDMAGENGIDPQAEDKELKGQLLRKYSGYLGSLKQEFLKKRKKGKLPKEARQQLLDWWNRHYRWPYPSESQKVALAQTTGLDQKQINNWFINQRKRHWKPSEEMQLAVVMDAAAAAPRPHYYVDGMVANPGLPPPLDCSHVML